MNFLHRLYVLTFFFLLLSFHSLHADSRVEIYNLRSYTHPAYTRIVIDIGKLREYTYNKLILPDRIYVDIYQSKLNPLLHNKSTIVNNGYIRQIRIAQKTKTTVRVVVDLNFQKIKHYRVWHLFDPFRIVIDIYSKKDRPAAKSKLSSQESPKPAQPSKSGYSLARQLGLGIKRIVIDPGHGGSDPGCIGRSGTYEKDIVLDVCMRLKKLLNKNSDFEVVLTRETDIYIPPENRTVIANQKQADMFISVHANANPSRSFSGVQTFFLNFTTDPNITRIAARENATSTKNIGNMKDIITKIVKNSKIMESKDLATNVQTQLVRQLSKKYNKVRNLNVRGGPFWVLIGGEMPSILIEISHLSNSREESRLKTPQYREHVAQGIYNGIITYITSLGKR